MLLSPMVFTRSFPNLGVALARAAYAHPLVRRASNSNLVSLKGHRHAHLPGSATELTVDLIRTSPSIFNELADESSEDESDED